MSNLELCAFVIHAVDTKLASTVDELVNLRPYNTCHI
jgi:hypothetical protein